MSEEDSSPSDTIYVVAIESLMRNGRTTTKLKGAFPSADAADDWASDNVMIQYHVKPVDYYD